MNVNDGFADEAPVKRRRRGMDWTVVAQLIAMVPSLLVGLGIITVVTAVGLSYVPNKPAWMQWAPFGAAGIWFLFGFLWFAPFTQGFLASSFLGFRKPVLAEHRHLEYSWREVLRRAGISDGKYRLWVEDTNELNASAVGGSIVSITRGAMRYGGVHLGALMAHELGHHLNGHTYPGLLAWWYSRPLYWVRALARLVLAIALGILRFVSYLSGFLALVGYLAICVVYLSVLYGLVRAVIWAWETSWPSVVVLVLAWLLAPIMGRQAEHRADRTAVQLGYGPQLVEVFREWQAMGADDHRGRGVRALWTASHPPLHSRIHRIEKQLARAGTLAGLQRNHPNNY